MKRLYIDLETYSLTNLKTSGVYRYSEDPEFRILMAAYSLDGVSVQMAVGEEAIAGIPGLSDPSVIKVAHNAMFERICLSRLLGLPTGEYLDPATFHDTMAVAGEQGLPQNLKDLAKRLGGEQKDEAGTALIKLFCEPNRKGIRVLPEEKPKEWADFINYCAQDVVTLIDVDKKLGNFPTVMERSIYTVDQHINDKGMKIDSELAQAAVIETEHNNMINELEISNLTGVLNPNSNMQLMGWLQKSGLVIADMQAETIERFLEHSVLTPTQRRVLELRQELALVATKKYPAALASVSSDGRVRGGFRFFGAHTGRWAGKGVQPHNLPRAGFKDTIDEEMAILDLKLGTGADSSTLKMLVRALFVGPFTVADYSAIEARVVAWLAGETWALKAFEDGRDIYVETAERMSTIANKLTRFQGKVAVLALGYNGGTASLRAMGAEGSDAALQHIVNQWRGANSHIVNLWGEMQDAFRSGGYVGDHMRIEKDGDDRLLCLPSGRSIEYHSVKWQSIDTEYGPRTEATFVDPRGRVKTYGGRLVENATQAIARDILAEALVRLHNHGYQTVGHVHDEVIVEGGSVDDVVRIITEVPIWAKGLPMDAAGFQSARYKKA